MPRFILLDIEGTTTDIDFVHRTLFPYAAERLSGYVTSHRNEPEVRQCLESVKQAVKNEEGFDIDDEGAIDTLLEWMADDRKDGALKKLQGLIWKTGFEQGDYRGHVYPDVPGNLSEWKAQGIELGIYSSGSVQAQQLLFGHSIAGDLTPCFSRYFDTAVGGKKESDSYRKITADLGLSSSDILFLSDIEAELDAAAEAGLQVIQLARGQKVQSRYPVVSSFDEIRLEEASLLC